MTRLWIVRAGAHGERELAAIDQSKLFPGFLEVGDLSACADRDAVLAHLQEVMPNEGKNRLRNFAAQLNQFVNRIEVGDVVVMPRKVTNGVAIGTVTGDYQFGGESDFKHSRTVEWKEESLPRDTFKQDLRHSFGAFMTICQIKRNSALERVQIVLETGTDPGSLLGKQGQAPKPLPVNGAEEDETEAEDYQTDIEDIAHQQIISLIKSEFAGHALADLVAEIMRVEGYTTKVSPPGADGGVDILAAGGTLGLGEDRICVQVKSGDGAAIVTDRVVLSPSRRGSSRRSKRLTSSCGTIGSAISRSNPRLMRRARSLCRSVPVVPSNREDRTESLFVPMAGRGAAIADQLSVPPAPYSTRSILDTQEIR